MNDLKTIIAENNYDVSFPFFGTTLKVTSERNVYTQIRKKYMALADSAEQRFNDYNSKFTNLDDLIASAPDALIMALEEALTEISQDAISVGIITLDAKTIIDLCFKNKYFDEFIEAYNSYVNTQDKIVSDLHDAYRYRENRKQSRGRWQSATFGGNAFDAWGNQMKAGAMNVTEGIGHSLVNAIGNASSEADAKQSMKSLFNNVKLRKKLVSSVWSCCNNLENLIVSTISDQASLNLGGWVTNDDWKKSTAIFNNVVKLSLTIDQQYEMLNEVLSLNPYKADYYEYIIKQFNDPDGELQKIAEFFYITGVDELKKKILFEFVEENIGTTTEEVDLCLETLETRIINVGLNRDDCDDVFNLVHDKKLEILLKYINDNIGETEDDANSCLKSAEIYMTKLNLTKDECFDLFQIIYDRLAKLDLEYRTVDEIVFDTRDQADEAKIEFKQITEIMNDIKAPDSDSLLPYEAHLIQVKEQIEQFNTQIKVKYIDILDKYLNDFDKSFKQVGFFKVAATRLEAGQKRALNFVRNKKMRTIEDVNFTRGELYNLLPLLGITVQDAGEAYAYLNDTHTRIMSGKKQQGIIGEKFSSLFGKKR